MRASLSLLVLGVLACVSARAEASPAFPGVIQTELKLARAPDCTICHTTPTGGLGTATTAFATYLRSRGLKATDEGSLRTALQAMIGEKHDTDGDGVTDEDALKAGKDPNGTFDSSVEPPRYGCGANVASRTPHDAWAPVAALGLLLLGLRRRARRGR